MLGRITQGDLKLWEQSSPYANLMKGFITHPDRLAFAISASETPSISEAYVVMAGNEIF